MNIVTKDRIERDRLAQNNWIKGKNTYRDHLIVSTVQIRKGEYEVLSYAGDAKWRLADNMFTSNLGENKKWLKFNDIPDSFVLPLKQVTLRYMYQGLPGLKRPRGRTLEKFIGNIKPFIRFLTSKGVHEFHEITPLITIQYMSHCQEIIQPNGKNLESGTLLQRFLVVETLYTLLRNTDHAFVHPWPESSAWTLANHKNSISGKTKIIPEQDLAKLMQVSVVLLEQASALLEYRANIEPLKVECAKQSTPTRNQALAKQLKKLGFIGTNGDLNDQLYDVLTACMLIILTTTGIRHSELASLKTDAYRSSIKNGERYYWIQGRSDKTNEGDCEWLAPKIAIRAMKVAAKVILPVQQRLENLIREARDNKDFAKVSSLKQHQNALLLGVVMHKNNDVTTLSALSSNIRINKFAKQHGISHRFSNHQFRRTFAVFVANHAMGDLRYLRDHFKHWSLDMTVLYSYNPNQDASIIQDIYLALKGKKTAIVQHWMEPDTQLSGGMAKDIRVFRDQTTPVKTYKHYQDMVENIHDHVYLRATGVAWCSSDVGGCNGGNGTNTTKCGDCNGSVIDDTHQYRWEQIYAQQIELNELSDLGSSGHSMVKKSLERCEKVLKDLGADIKQLKANVQAKLRVEVI